MSRSSGQTVEVAATAAALYDRALVDADPSASKGTVRRPERLTAHYGEAVWTLPVSQWCGPADAADRAALEQLRAELPSGADVVDLGCGPGRHTAHLHSLGLRALGVDTSAVAVDMARRRGAPAVQTDAMRPLPGAHHGWDGALLLDGNIGIGGDPVLLLCRVRDLLRSTGRVLVELDPQGADGRGSARVALDGRMSAPFPWARVSPAGLAAAAACAGLTVRSAWTDSGRSFALLAVDAGGRGVVVPRAARPVRLRSRER